MEVRTEKGQTVYFYADLVLAEYENLFFKLYFTDGKDYRVEITVKELLEKLPPKAFFLCSRNTIINICRYSSSDALENEIWMDNGMKVNASSRKMKEFIKHKDSLPGISLPCPNSHTCSNENCPERLMFCLPKKEDDC